MASRFRRKIQSPGPHAVSLHLYPILIHRDRPETVASWHDFHHPRQREMVNAVTPRVGLRVRVSAQRDLYAGVTLEHSHNVLRVPYQTDGIIVAQQGNVT